MRVLVLSKRQYMGKDLLDDGYGRFYELPLELARLGHDVVGLCASYRRRPDGEFPARRDGAGVLWHARNVPPLSPVAIARWLAAARDAVRRFHPEVIWACSDSFHAMLGARLQRLCGVPCVVDLYDNFESYAATWLPGVRPMFRRAVGNAAGATCVSEALEGYIRRTCVPQDRTIVLENGVSPLFRPLERLECRRRFGLPADAKIIGTAGAIGAQRGSDVLLRAFLRLAASHADLHLLLAGGIHGGFEIPKHPRIVDLGERPHDEVPHILGAMDVAVVCNRRSAFGDYCFPQKLYEILACGVPPAVADTMGVSRLLSAAPRHRFDPGSETSLAATIEGLLAAPQLPPFGPKSWASHGATLSGFLAQVRAAWVSQDAHQARVSRKLR